MDSLGTLEFRALFEAERDRLMRFLCHLTGNASDAEDLLQETFLAVWRKREQFTGRGSAAGYLRRTAFRLFLNARENTDRREAIARKTDEEPSHTPMREFDDQEERKALVARVHTAVQNLPDGPREAFVMFRYEGLSCAEIADTTGTTVKAIEMRIARAVQILTTRLASHASKFTNEGAR